MRPQSLWYLFVGLRIAATFLRVIQCVCMCSAIFGSGIDLETSRCTSSSGQHSVCRQSAHILKIPPTPNFAWKHGRSGREEAIASGGEAAMAKAGGALLPGRAGLGTRLTRAFPLFKTPDSPKTLSLHQSVFVFHSMLVECWPELLV